MNLPVWAVAAEQVAVEQVAVEQSALEPQRLTALAGALPPCRTD